MKRNIFDDPAAVALLLRLYDGAAILLAAKIAVVLRFGSIDAALAPIYAVLPYFCCALGCAIFPRFGLYEPWHASPAGTHLSRLCVAWSSTLFCGIVFSFLIRHAGELSRLWLFYWLASGMLLLTLLRCALRAGLPYARRHGWEASSVLLVGCGTLGGELQRRIRQPEQYDYTVRAVCPAPGETAGPDQPGITTLDSYTQIPAYVASHNIQEIWIALPLRNAALVSSLQQLMRNHFIEIRWILDLEQLHILCGNMNTFFGFPSIPLNCPDTGNVHRIGKYLFDKLFSLSVLLLLAPLLLAISIGVRLSSPGPVFFLQRRIGLNGAEFRVFKFRTMLLQQDGAGPLVQASRHDSRVTPFGAFLRRTSLDELPQFLNVLLGDMSIVGPRPHAVQHTELYRDLLDVYMVRHRAKPGITGWAQINGYRGETDTVEKMVKRVQYDLYYIRHGSLWLDLRIVLWTACKGWTGHNTY